MTRTAMDLRPSATPTGKAGEGDPGTARGASAPPETATERECIRDRHYRRPSTWLSFKFALFFFFFCQNKTHPKRFHPPCPWPPAVATTCGGGLRCSFQRVTWVDRAVLRTFTCDKLLSAQRPSRPVTDVKLRGWRDGLAGSLRHLPCRRLPRYHTCGLHASTTRAHTSGAPEHHWVCSKNQKKKKKIDHSQKY